MGLGGGFDLQKGRDGFWIEGVAAEGWGLHKTMDT